MNPSALHLECFVPSGPDFAKALAFFLDLGFSTRWQAGGYAGLELGNARFILQDFHNQEMASNLMLALRVPDLDAWWAHLQSGVLARHGVRASPPEMKPWGVREIHLIDLAGVCWHIAQA